MRIIHRVALRATAAQRSRLTALEIAVPTGIVLPGGGDPLVSVEVAEDHKNWPTVEMLIREWKAGDSVRTQFTPEELAEAVWLEIQPEWHHGYPQPSELDYGYLAATYNLAEYCKKCGAGKRQKAPFWMKGEPRWGSRGILQLNWVFDEYFVRPEVYGAVFKAAGVPCTPVLDRHGQHELTSVVQLCVAGEGAPLALDGYPYQTCRVCGRRKYVPITRGKFPPLLDQPTGQVVKSHACFGSGGSAWHAVIVSGEIYRQLLHRRVKGASFVPLA